VIVFCMQIKTANGFVAVGSNRENVLEVGDAR